MSKADDLMRDVKYANLEAVLKRSIRGEFKDAIEAIEKKIILMKQLEQNRQRNYFRDTEKLLYAYPLLKKKIEEDDFLVEMAGKSADIVRIKTPAAGGNPDREAVAQEYENSRLASIEKTKKEVQRIERALDEIRYKDKAKIQEDEGYRIITMKYFEGLNNEEIAEQTNYAERTIQRHKNRMINRLKVIIWGAEALDV